MPLFSSHEMRESAQEAKIGSSLSFSVGKSLHGVHVATPYPPFLWAWAQKVPEIVGLRQRNSACFKMDGWADEENWRVTRGQLHIRQFFYNFHLTQSMDFLEGVGKENNPWARKWKAEEVTNIYFVWFLLGTRIESNEGHFIIKSSLKVSRGE